MTERTERLGIMGEGVERLEENSAGWASDVEKFVSRQKRGLVMGGELCLLSSFLSVLFPFSRAGGASCCSVVR